MTSETKRKINKAGGRKPQWSARAKVPRAAAPTDETVWDDYSFAHAMDTASEELVYEPKVTPAPRHLVYRLRLDEREMASLQGLAKQRGVPVSVVLRELVGEASRSRRGDPLASLTLRNVPDGLLGALRAAAEGDRRSLNQEVIHLLISAVRAHVERATPRPLGVEAQLAAWRKLAGTWEADVDPATEAEQLEERRSPGREVDL